MRRVVLALALSLTALPALAGGLSMDLPRLTWPQDGQTTTSTKGCEATPQPATAACK